MTANDVHGECPGFHITSSKVDVKMASDIIDNHPPMYKAIKNFLYGAQ